jgi:rhodanese-related sulfurtransferase
MNIKNFLFSATLLPFTVMADFTHLSTQAVQAKMAKGVAIIDVRRVDEFEQYGVIPGAHKMTFFDERGNYNAKQWLDDLSKIIKTKDTPFILVCAHANRSKTIGRFLDAKTDYKNIFELKGGINYGWIDKGLATTKISAIKQKAWYQF